MTDRLEQTLPDALHHLAQQAPAHPLDAAPFRRHATRQRRWMIAAPVAAVLVVVAVLAGMALSQPRSTGPAGPAKPSACAPLQTGPIPVWVRAGFTGDSYPPFATSSSGNVVAIVFGDPLSAPPDPVRSNKVLWVQHYSQVDPGPVTARLEGTNRVIQMSIPNGPSTVDMPAAGCWHLEWGSGDTHDSINLRWTKP